MRFIKIFFFLIIALSLSHCGNLPRPYQHDEANPSTLSKPTNYSGIVVEGIKNVPVADSMIATKVMILGLEKNKIMARKKEVKGDHLYLKGFLDKDEHKNLSLNWYIENKEKKKLSHFKQRISASEEYWSQNSTQFLSDLVTLAIPQLTKKIKKLEEKAPTVKNAHIKKYVFVDTIFGVSKNSNIALQRTLRQMLKRYGFKIATERQKADLILEGKVNLSKPTQNKQHVQIVWNIKDPNNKKLGHVEQNNNIKAGTLEKIWRSIIPFIAEGAADGITTAYRKIQANNTNY